MPPEFGRKLQHSESGERSVLHWVLSAYPAVCGIQREADIITKRNIFWNEMFILTWIYLIVLVQYSILKLLILNSFRIRWLKIPIVCGEYVNSDVFWRRLRSTTLVRTLDIWLEDLIISDGCAYAFDSFSSSYSTRERKVYIKIN